MTPLGDEIDLTAQELEEVKAYMDELGALSYDRMTVEQIIEYCDLFCWFDELGAEVVICYE